jgi:hypothetical protein
LNAACTGKANHAVIVVGYGTENGDYVYIQLLNSSFRQAPLDCEELVE